MEMPLPEAALTHDLKHRRVRQAHSGSGDSLQTAGLNVLLLVACSNSASPSYAFSQELESFPESSLTI
jgi:hypothetical protein